MAKCTMTMIFGTDPVSAFSNGAKKKKIKKVIDEMGGHMETYHFATHGEAVAFLNGVSAMDGWGAYAIYEETDV